MKSILIVNDDGVHSPGIRAAAEAVRPLGKITIVAPAVQQSGVGRSMSLFRPVGISRVGVNEYAIDGTPVDAVVVGIYGVLRKKPDLIISGINIGGNISCEVTTSGTVCAALEGASQGINSISISLHVKSNTVEQIHPEIDFSPAKDILRKVARRVIEDGLPGGVDLLNINVPEGAGKKVKFTRLAERMYTTRVQERFDPRGRKYFWIDGDAIYDAEEGTDVHAVRIENCISITPLKLDFTSHEAVKDVKKLEKLLKQSLPL